MTLEEIMESPFCTIGPSQHKLRVKWRARGVWMGGPGDLGKPSVDQSFWERALIWI